MNLSSHFTLEEAVASETASRQGISNRPPDDILTYMKETATHMEIVRNVLGDKSIHINSWFRCPILNGLVGSKSTSQHILGEAVDFICPAFGTPVEVCKHLIDHRDVIGFDQLILEHTWIHISFAVTSRKPRDQVLSLLSTGGYALGLTDKWGNNV